MPKESSQLERSSWSRAALLREQMRCGAPFTKQRAMRFHQGSLWLMFSAAIRRARAPH